MPTFESKTSFKQDYKRLTREQRKAFKAIIPKFVADLKAGRFRPGLHIQAVESRKGAWEITWAPDGRATFEYGREKLPGEKHIVWRRIGGHEILDNP
jgi:hypothetical protein